MASPSAVVLPRRRDWVPSPDHPGRSARARGTGVRPPGSAHQGREHRKQPLPPAICLWRSSSYQEFHRPRRSASPVKSAAKTKSLSSMHFRLDVCEFLRVGNDTNGPNMPGLHFNGQHGKGARTCASNQGRLTIDFCQLKTSVLW